MQHRSRAQAGTANNNFTNLQTTGDINITTANGIGGTYSGVNGTLHSTAGAVNATVNFDTLDITGISSTLLAGRVGVAGVADQAMANRISIGGVSAPVLVSNPAYTFATYTIGYTGAVIPPSSGGSPTPPSPPAPTPTPPAPTPSPTPPSSGPVLLPASLQTALPNIINGPDFSTNVTTGNFVLGNLSDTDFYSTFGNENFADLEVKDRDLEKEERIREQNKNEPEKKHVLLGKKLYRYTSALWRLLQGQQ